MQREQIIGVFENALKRLRDRLHYLYSDQERFWLDTRPNLRREMEGRKQTISEREQIQPLLKERVGRVFGSKHSLAAIHVFTPSADIPDEYGANIRLVVLPPEAAYSKSTSDQALSVAADILQKKGDQPRQKQNRLVFLAADQDVLPRLKDQARTFLSWRSIVQDIDDGKLNLDLFQVKLAKKNKDAAEQNFMQLVRETYKYLLCPTQGVKKGKGELEWEIQPLEWEVQALSPSAANLVAEIERKLQEEQWLTSTWSAIHLKSLLGQWYFRKGVTEISVQKVWQDCCHYLYLPRLANDQVLKNAITQGLASDEFFGFAVGKEDDAYFGFAFDKPTIVSVDAHSLLIEREAAKQYLNQLQAKARAEEEKTAGTQKTTIPSSTSGTEGKDPTDTPKPNTALKTQFYATIDIDPVIAKMKFNELVDEVVQLFSTQSGVHTTLKIEIEASSQVGFDENQQRAVKENCSTLKFKTSEFN